jgi:hypothetical protein
MFRPAIIPTFNYGCQNLTTEHVTKIQKSFRVQSASMLGTSLDRDPLISRICKLLSNETPLRYSLAVRINFRRWETSREIFSACKTFSLREIDSHSAFPPKCDLS